MNEAIFTEFPEIEIETTITYGLWKFQNRKMELPLEVQLTPIGLEVEGWRRWAINVLREANKKRQESVIYVH